MHNNAIYFSFQSQLNRTPSRQQPSHTRKQRDVLTQHVFMGKEFANATSEKKTPITPCRRFFDMLFSDIYHAKSCKKWLVRRNPQKV